MKVGRSVVLPVLAEKFTTTQIVGYVSLEILEYQWNINSVPQKQLNYFECLLENKVEI